MSNAIVNVIEGELLEADKPGLYVFYNSTGHMIGAISAEPGCGSDRVINILGDGADIHMTIVRVPNTTVIICTDADAREIMRK